MAAFTPSSILIFGGTGQIGQYITSSIVRAQPSFPSVTLFTSPTTAATKTALLDAWKARGLKVITGDVTSTSDVTSAYAGVDTVISCVGRNVLAHQLELMRLAEESDSVKWFFPSEYGTDVEHNEKSKDERPHQLKLKVRKYAREELKKLKVSYLVSGPYFEMWLDTISGAEEVGGFEVQKKNAWVIDEGEGRIGFCTMWDVGKGVVAALQHPSETFNKPVRVQSFVVTPNEVLAEFEKQTGGEKWTVTKTPLEKVKQLEEQKWAESWPKAVNITLRRIWAEGGTLYERNDNELVGLTEKELEPLAEVIKRHIFEGGWKNDDVK